MKTLLFIITGTLFFNFSSSAQITLDHSFNVGVYDPNDPTPWLSYEAIVPQRLSSGLKYFHIRYGSSTINVYNTDYTFYRAITLPALPNAVLRNWYFTDKLFDLDDEIEYVSADFENVNLFDNFNIYNEDGSVLFSMANTKPITADYFISSLQFQNWIYYSDEDSTYKMLLRETDTVANVKEVKVFTLPGTISGSGCCCSEGLAGMPQLDPFYSEMQVLPNPSQLGNVVRLPQGISAGELIVYSMQGDEVKRIPFVANTQELEMNNSLLPSGTYFYKLAGKDPRFNQTKKVLIIK